MLFYVDICEKVAYSLTTVSLQFVSRLPHIKPKSDNKEDVMNQLIFTIRVNDGGSLKVIDPPFICPYCKNPAEHFPDAERAFCGMCGAKIFQAQGK